MYNVTSAQQHQLLTLDHKELELHGVAPVPEPGLSDSKAPAARPLHYLTCLP